MEAKIEFGRENYILKGILSICSLKIELLLMYSCSLEPSVGPAL